MNWYLMYVAIGAAWFEVCAYRMYCIIGKDGRDPLSSSKTSLLQRDAAQFLEIIDTSNKTPSAIAAGMALGCFLAGVIWPYSVIMTIIKSVRKVNQGE